VTAYFLFVSVWIIWLVPLSTDAASPTELLVSDVKAIENDAAVIPSECIVFVIVCVSVCVCERVFVIFLF
jgi:hypothetical protein